MNTTTVEYLSEKPDAVTFTDLTPYVNVEIRTNIHEEKDDPESENVTYVCDCTRFLCSSEELTDELKSKMISDPEHYVQYVPVRYREAITKEYTDAVQAWMDSVAHEKGYDNIFTAISYADSSVPSFKEEALACKTWRDQVWVACHIYLDNVLADKEVLVTVEELIASLPKIVWPN